MPWAPRVWLQWRRNNGDSAQEFYTHLIQQKQSSMKRKDSPILHLLYVSVKQILGMYIYRTAREYTFIVNSIFSSVSMK